MTQKTNQNPWTMDVRVRERNLKSGALTDKDLEKFLGALPDVGGDAESFAAPQPALAQPPAPPPLVQHAAAPESEPADDDEDEEVSSPAPSEGDVEPSVPSDGGGNNG